MIKFLSAVCAATMLLAACATPPAQQMADARDALLAARSAGADRYSTLPFEQAESNLKEASRQLELDDYAKARRYANDARAGAARALAIADQLGSLRHRIDQAKNAERLWPSAQRAWDKALDAGTRGQLDRLPELILETERLLSLDGNEAGLAGARRLLADCASPDSDFYYAAQRALRDRDGRLAEQSALRACPARPAR